MDAHDDTRDRGTILVLTLAITVVLGAVVISVASYATTGLRYGKVVESRADRLAAADGGTRYAIGRLNAGAGRLCATGSPDVIEAPSLNDASVNVTCRVVGPGFDYTNGWAMILTGEEIPPATDPACSSSPDGDPCALLKSASGVSVEKLIGGPVYMADASFGLKSPVELQRAQLFYTSSDCTVPPAIPSNLTFDESSLGVTCTSKPWSRQPDKWSAADASSGLFHEPNMATMPTDLDPAPVVINDGTACKVFLPGYYTTPPALGSANYFMSGDYVFDGFTLTLTGQKVTFGRSATTGSTGDTQFLPNEACDDVRASDHGYDAGGVDTTPTELTVSEAGATIYLRNGARFVIDANSTMEVLRRKQGRSYVSLHVIDDSLTWNDKVVEQVGGTNKDMAIHGLVWAPEASIQFTEITNTANGQLLGGVVVSNIDLRSSAAGTGFVVAVEPSDLWGKLQLDSVADLGGERTTIRSIVDFRPSTGYVAVTSWRVRE
jgi:hypothetical protein